MNEEIFGSTLQIKDAFSNTFTAFSNGTRKSSNNFIGLQNSINSTNSSINGLGKNMSKSAIGIGNSFNKVGQFSSASMKNTFNSIDKTSKDSSNNVENNWKNTFNNLKDKGESAFKSLTSSMNSFSNSTTGMVTKLTAGFLSVATAKKGLTEGLKVGMEYESSRMTLDTLYGDKQKGGEQFKMATKFANATPWEESETVGSLVKMKAYGLKDTEEFMTEMSDLGSAFKSMGQNMDTATEAYADMMNGEWERMKSFGIKRESLEAFAKENNLGKFTNKKGQITNKDKLEEVFKAYMDDKGYTGMTKGLSQTATGQLSTATGNLKKSLAELVGITEEGGVKDGSLFQSFTRGMDTFTNKLNAFAGSESFEIISEDLGKLGNGIVSGLSYLAEHPELASTLVKFGVGLFAFKGISSLISPLGTVLNVAKMVGPAFGAMSLTIAPALPFILGISGAMWGLASVVSPDGVLHKGVSWLLGKFPVIGEDLQKGFEEGTGIIRNWFSDLWGWVKSSLGFGSSNEYDASNHTEDTEFNRKWYPENFKTTENVSEYKTVSSMYKAGDITKVDNSKSTGDINMPIHIDKVEKDADVDNIMSEVASRIKKYQATRNALG